MLDDLVRLIEVGTHILEQNPSIDRRGFLEASIGTGVAANEALTQPDEWSVSYLWHNDIEVVRDYKEDIARVLGTEVAKDLKIVRGNQGRISGTFGLVYERSGDRSGARTVARHHATVLARSDIDSGATDVSNADFDSLFNISFGKGPNLDALIYLFPDLYSRLGPDLGGDLFIEETPDGEYALIYRRLTDRETALNRAERLGNLVSDMNLGASIIEEKGNDVVYSESSFLNVEAENRRTEVAVTKEPETRPSSSTISSNLENGIERLINGFRSRDIIHNSERTAWVVYDFTTDQKIVSINEDRPMQAASMIKPLALLAFFHEVERGRFSYGSRSKRNAEASIQRSSNTATNWIIRQVGGPRAVQRLLQRHYGGMLPQTSVVEYIPSGGTTYRNKASAHDYSRFLHAMWNNNIPMAREMRRLMALPGRDRIYNGTVVPRGTLVYNKTGSTSRLCGDMGILSPRDANGERFPYIIVGMVERDNRDRDESYSTWIARRGNVIRSFSTEAFREMDKRHNLR